MDITSHRSEFMVFVVDDEESIREIVRETLVTSGYQVETFPTAEDALARLKESPPHLIFSDIRMPGMSGIELLERVKQLSKDIEYVIMTSHASLDTAVNAMKLGAYDYLYKPFENLGEIVSTADRTIERVYMKLENEQLLEELEGKNKLLSTVNQKIAKENKEIQQVNDLMHKLAKTMEPDGVIQILIEAVSQVGEDKPVLFLKFLPAYSSLVVTHSVILPVDGLKSMGLNMEAFGLKEIPAMLVDPMQLAQLKEMMGVVFKTENYYSFPFIHQNQPVGIVVSFSPMVSDSARHLVESFLQISRVSYENAILAARVREMAIKDPLTNLYNRRYFNEKLEDEMNRSRRTKFPVSLIYLDIDHFKKYNDTNGHPMGDVIIKSVAQILAKTSRKTDIVARLGGEEFAVLCPHTSATGAAIKAEKIRLTIENTKFPNGEKQPLGKVSVSLGVSEYPSFVNDSQLLIRSADDALYKVKQGGRNKVCMAEAPQGFIPDFTPIQPPDARTTTVIGNAGNSGSAATNAPAAVMPASAASSEESPPAKTKTGAA